HRAPRLPSRRSSDLPDGQEIPEADKNKYLLHQMPYDSIRKFDVGTKPNPAFPQQARFKTYIPLFGELIDSVEQFTKEKGFKPVIDRKSTRLNSSHVK